jgi:hypothetical protein
MGIQQALSRKSIQEQDTGFQISDADEESVSGEKEERGRRELPTDQRSRARQWAGWKAGAGSRDAGAGLVLGIWNAEPGINGMTDLRPILHYVGIGVYLYQVGQLLTLAVVFWMSA